MWTARPASCGHAGSNCFLTERGCRDTFVPLSESVLTDGDDYSLNSSFTVLFKSFRWFTDPRGSSPWLVGRKAWEKTFGPFSLAAARLIVCERNHCSSLMYHEIEPLGWIIRSSRVSARWPVEILNILPVPLLPYKEVQLGLHENVMVAPKYLSLTMSGQLHIFFLMLCPPRVMQNFGVQLNL